MKFKNMKYPEPIFNKNYVLIAMTSSNEYYPYLTVTLMSLIDHASNSRNYDILILSAGITYKNQQYAQELVRGRTNFSIRFIEIGPLLDSLDFFVRDHYKPIIYARLILPEITHQYPNKLIYLDSDLIINTDIAELDDLVRFAEGQIVAAVRDIGMITVYHTKGRPEKNYLDEYLELKHPEDYFNSGVLVFNLRRFREEYDIEFLLNYATSRKWLGQDQDIFSTLCDGKTLLLPQEWNVMIQYMHTDNDLGDRATPSELKKKYMQARNSPKIIHFIENKMLLMDPPCDLFQEFWRYARKTSFYRSLLVRMAKAKPIFQPDNAYSWKRKR